MANRIKSGTLVVDTVATVTFPKWYAYVEVTNRSTNTTDVITATLGTATVTKLGDDFDVIMPGKSVIIRNPQPGPSQGAGSAGGDTDVQLISNGPALYTVKGL